MQHTLCAPWEVRITLAARKTDRSSTTRAGRAELGAGRRAAKVILTSQGAHRVCCNPICDRAANTSCLCGMCEACHFDFCDLDNGADPFWCVCVRRRNEDDWPEVAGKDCIED